MTLSGSNDMERAVATQGPSSETAPAHGSTEAVVEIKPTTGWRLINLGELWQYRDLLVFLAWRDVKVRYRQTVLGATWVLLQPLLTMTVFAIFFGRLAKMPSNGIPYPIWCYCGLLPWTYFSYVLTQSSNSLVNNQNLVKKVFFPRLVIPLSNAVDGLVDFSITLSVLFIMMWWYGIHPTSRIALLPPIMLLAISTVIGMGLWLSALNVEYRDVRYVVPFLTQFWMFISPVVYPASLVPVTYKFGSYEVPLRTLYGLNPMVGVIEGFRWTLLGTDQPLDITLWPAVVVSAMMLISGLHYFKRMERRFADVV
jgi:homopolymeric O-antigen transport system permease protein